MQKIEEIAKRVNGTWGDETILDEKQKRTFYQKDNICMNI